MSALEASTVRLQTMADGTLRLVVDFEPTQAQAAFRLFGAPGTPVALARIKTKAEQSQSKQPKGGPLARLAGQWSQSEAFWQWAGVDDSDTAAQYIRATCGVESRAELDHNAEAADRFHVLIREPFSAYLKDAPEKQDDRD